MMNRKGFTLVELMIVVAIIGILAAIAIPNFVNMQYRAKRAEVPSNVDGIKTAQLAYEASFDQFVAETTPQPDEDPGKAQRPWNNETNFATLGWGPDGDVRGSYSTNTASDGTGFKIEGTCDVDGDGNDATYNADHSTSSSMNATLSSGDTNVY